MLKSKVGLLKNEAKGTRLDAELEEHIALVESPSREYSFDQAQQNSPSSSRGNSATFSDSDTIYDSAGPEAQPVDSETPRSRLHRFVSAVLDLAMRLLIILAYIDMFTGVAVYTGVCRGNYLNG